MTSMVLRSGFNLLFALETIVSSPVSLTPKVICSSKKRLLR